MTTDGPSAAQFPITDPTIIEVVRSKTSPWLKPLKRGLRRRPAVVPVEWPSLSAYLTDGRRLYRVAALLGAPVAAIVLEDCQSSTELLCTRVDLRAMRLRGVA